MPDGNSKSEQQKTTPKGLQKQPHADDDV